MAANFVQNGKYGQVEPNRLTGIVSANMEAQAPAYTTAAATTPISQLENGQFLCVIADTAGVSPLGRIAVLPGAAPASAKPYLVFSERKQYDERKGYSDFVDKASDKVDGKLYPRLVGLTPDSCVFTFNTVTLTDVDDVPDVGDILYIGDDGFAAESAGKNIAYQLEIVKVYTLPDGSPAFKVMVQSMPTVGVSGIATNGLPEGGTAGQILSKVNGVDFKAEWIDAPEEDGLPEGGTAGQLLSKVDATDYNAEWVTPTNP